MSIWKIDCFEIIESCFGSVEQDNSKTGTRLNLLLRYQSAVTTFSNHRHQLLDKKCCLVLFSSSTKILKRQTVLQLFVKGLAVDALALKIFTLLKFQSSRTEISCVLMHGSAFSMLSMHGIAFSMLSMHGNTVPMRPCMAVHESCTIHA